MTERAFDARQLRDAFGAYPTGVAVMSGYRADGRAVGITANSFVSVSLDPPLIAWCLSNRSSSLSAFLENSNFAVTILGEGQEKVASRFASPSTRDLEARHRDVDGPTAPSIDGELCRLDCRVVSTAVTGDHVLIVGEVLSLRHRKAPPLLFCGGRFGRVLTNHRTPPIDLWAHLGDAWAD